MHDLVSFNHKIIPAEHTLLPAISHAGFYGKGIFTTVAIFNTKPFLWRKHWLRLIDNAKKINVNLSKYSEQTVKQSLTEIITANKITNGRTRLTFFDESLISIWQTEQKSQTSFLINTAHFREVSKQLRLTVSPFRTSSASPLSGVKSCNYLENILALQTAQAKGFDEAIRINERNEVVSACMSNIFWLKDNRVFTPSIDTGCLAGTTREFILENYTVCEKQAKLNELNESDAIFLTSAGIGIAQVFEFQEKKFLNKELTTNQRDKPKTLGFLKNLELFLNTNK
jgi:branched-subunit amino acid aminotransferase/4-amino-4-deoxychorismate lyase